MRLSKDCPKRKIYVHTRPPGWFPPLWAAGIHVITELPLSWRAQTECNYEEIRKHLSALPFSCRRACLCRFHERQVLPAGACDRRQLRDAGQRPVRPLLRLETRSKHPGGLRRKGEQGYQNQLSQAAHRDDRLHPAIFFRDHKGGIFYFHLPLPLGYAADAFRGAQTQRYWKLCCIFPCL